MKVTIKLTGWEGGGGKEDRDRGRDRDRGEGARKVYASLRKNTNWFARKRTHASSYPLKLCLSNDSTMYGSSFPPEISVHSILCDTDCADNASGRPIARHSV